MAKNSKTVIFNKKLYNLDAIRKAMAAFRELGDFQVQTVGTSYKVIIKNSDREVGDALEDEFANYVLAETKNG